MAYGAAPTTNIITPLETRKQVQLDKIIIKNYTWRKSQMENIDEKDHIVGESELEKVSGGGRGRVLVCHYEHDYRHNGNIKVEKRFNEITFRIEFWGQCRTWRDERSCAQDSCTCLGRPVCRNGWHLCKEDGAPCYNW